MKERQSRIKIENHCHLKITLADEADVDKK